MERHGLKEDLDLRKNVELEVQVGRVGAVNGYSRIDIIYLGYLN